MQRVRKILIIMLFIVTGGAGPCDVMKLGADETGGDSTDEDTAAETCGDLNVSCNHSLDIEILLAGDEEFAPGMYTFSVTAPDASVYSIDCMLNRADAGLECLMGSIDQLSATIDPADLATIEFSIAGAPPTCVVQVFFNDFEIANTFLEPEYVLSYPNGENCQPTCYNGEDYIAVALW